MKFKYEKEVDKLIKLIYDYWIKEKIKKKIWIQVFLLQMKKKQKL